MKKMIELQFTEEQWAAIITNKHEECKQEIIQCQNSKEDLDKAFDKWKNNLPTNFLGGN